MKISKLNLGRPLTKDQQKQIKGGSGVCTTSEYLKCTCVGGTYCLLGDGVHDANWICSTFCVTHGGGGTHGPCKDPFCVEP